jgi:16S rRNA pseudouridine516 synthase
MKLVKHLASLGYGSRREVQLLVARGAFTDTVGRVLAEGDLPDHERIRFRGEALDPAAPLVVILHKPTGFTCSTADPGAVVYDLLPPRFSLRNPPLSPIGRLDKDTSGLLLLTDDGAWLHRVSHPKSGPGKTYHVVLDRPLQGTEAELFASGTLMLRGEATPLLPAQLELLGPHEARVVLHEGRYHQVRRMFAAAGNHVLTLQRVAFGGLTLPADLEAGQWRVLTTAQREEVLPSY